MLDLVDRNSPIPCRFCCKNLAALLDQPRYIPRRKDRQRKQHATRRTNYFGMVDINGFRREPQGTCIERCRCSNNGSNISRILELLPKNSQDSRLSKNLSFIPCRLPYHSKNALRCVQIGQS